MRCPASSRWEIRLGLLTIWPIVFPSAGDQEVLLLEDNGEAAEGVAEVEVEVGVVEASLMLPVVVVEEVAVVAVVETAEASVEVAEVQEYLPEVESQKNRR